MTSWGDTRQMGKTGSGCSNGELSGEGEPIRLARKVKKVLTARRR